jgi:hypothetical protein
LSNVNLHEAIEKASHVSKSEPQKALPGSENPKALPAAKEDPKTSEANKDDHGDS